MAGNRDDKAIEGLIPVFSEVVLKDGREGAVVDVYTKPTLGYEIDFTNPDDDDISIEAVPPEEIAKVLSRPK